MRIALIGLAALLPSLASAQDASPAPYVLHQGRAVRTEAAAPEGSSAHQSSAEGGSSGVATRQVSAFGAAPVRTGIVGGRSFFGRSWTPAPAARAFRGSSFRRGVTGSARRAAADDSAPPAFAVPGAKIISEGQQPVYSEAADGGTHSVEGGGFIAMDQAKAHDVGRAPGISWAPPDTPPSATRVSMGGGSGASANGPAPAGGSSTDGSGGHISGTGSGGNNNQGNNGQGSGGQGNNGGDQNNSITFNPAF